MEFILCHIPPLVVDTYTHTQTSACTKTILRNLVHTWFKKPLLYKGKLWWGKVLPSHTGSKENLANKLKSVHIYAKYILPYQQILAKKILVNRSTFPLPKFSHVQYNGFMIAGNYNSWKFWAREKPDNKMIQLHMKLPSNLLHYYRDIKKNAM